MKHWSKRSGVWVEADQGVGIVHHEKVKGPDGQPTGQTEPWIHLVKDDGTTLAQIPAAVCGNVRQARADAIPKSRIEHLTAEQLAALGYV